MSGDKKFHVLQKGRQWFIRENDAKPADPKIGEKMEKYHRSYATREEAKSYIDRVLASAKFSSFLETPPTK